MDSARSVSKSFDLLDTRIQRWIVHAGWDTLRSAQEQAIPIILGANLDVIVSAPTAAGKTEAVFFPTLTKILQEDLPSIRVLYVAPLKALINDQFSRLELLCQDLEIPVHRWHGDVGQTRKTNLVKHPRGLLLITPESLEAVLMRQGPRAASMFKHLDYTILDEVHSYIGSERGAQLRSLMHRVETIAQKFVPRIGLSATLSEPIMAAQFMRQGQGSNAAIITSDGCKTIINAQLRAYLSGANAGDDNDAQDSAHQSIVNFMFDKMRGHSNLIFCNQKDKVELFTDSLSEKCREGGVPDEFCAHHGNLSKELREHAEQRLKSTDAPVTCVCTSTLEMGIDIGAMDSIGQVNAPNSVSSLRQRVGRSGRRDSPPVLRMAVQEPTLSATSSLVDQLRLELVQSTAMLLLMLEGWCEPTEDAPLHLSTLIQQIVSVIVQRGGANIPHLYNLLVSSGPFRTVARDQFVELMRSMKSHDLIVQMEDGIILLGKKGERIAEHYSFYASFTSQEEYRLVVLGKSIGTIPLNVPLQIGDPLLFAGKRWQVLSVDEEKRIIVLTPSRGKRPPVFKGQGGRVNRRIRERMREVLEATDIPVFLDSNARELLSEARSQYERSDLKKVSILDFGRQTLLFHWTGDREANTLRLLLEGTGLSVDPDPEVTVVEAGYDSTVAALKRIDSDDMVDPISLAVRVKNKQSEKYDWVLTEELMCAEYAARDLDVPAATQVARILLASE